MHKLFNTACLLFITILSAQPKLELQQGTFSPTEAAIPTVSAEKLIELTKNWASEFNRREGGFDITDVTANTITISAFRDNAFFYRNRGEAFDHKIRYDMQLTFSSGVYRVNFAVREIYYNDKLIASTLPDYYNSQGNLKEGYEDVKPSIEATVNNIIRSHYNFLVNFR